MPFPVHITPKALNDIKAAREYYNEKAEGLGEKFFLDVERNIQTIADNPGYFSERYKNVRGKQLNRFPFVIYYAINYQKQIVQVLRIFNTIKALIS